MEPASPKERSVLQFVGNGIIRNVSVPLGRIPSWQRIARIAQRALGIHKDDFIVALLCENAQGDILDLADSASLAEAWERVQTKRFLVIHVRFIISPARKKNPRPSPPTHTKPKTAVEYSLGPQIGQGEFGPVYVCYLPRFKNYAAVKEYHPLPDEQGRDEPSLAASRRLERLRHEVNFLRHSQHKNILKYFGIEQNGNTFRVLMEYLDGGTLRQYLNQSGPLPLPMVKAFLLDVLSALDHMHSHGIVHGAVESDNILLSSEGVVKLSGLGFARRLQKKKKFSHASKSDIFNVGITVLEMVTGKQRPGLLDLLHDPSPTVDPSLLRDTSDDSKEGPILSLVSSSSYPPKPDAPSTGESKEDLSMGTLSRARSASEAGVETAVSARRTNLEMISENWMEEKEFNWDEQPVQSSSLNDSEIRRRASTLIPGVLDEELPGEDTGPVTSSSKKTPGRNWEEVVVSSGGEAAKHYDSSKIYAENEETYLLGPNGTSVTMDGVNKQRIVLKDRHHIRAFLKTVLPQSTPASLVQFLQLCLLPERDDRPGAKSLVIHPFLFDRASPRVSSRASIQHSLAEKLKIVAPASSFAPPLSSISKCPSFGGASILTTMPRPSPIPLAAVYHALHKSPPIRPLLPATNWVDEPWFNTVDESEIQLSDDENVPARGEQAFKKTSTQGSEPNPPSIESPVEETIGGDVLATSGETQPERGAGRNGVPVEEEEEENKEEDEEEEQHPMISKLQLGSSASSPADSGESPHLSQHAGEEDSVSIDLDDVSDSKDGTPLPAMDKTTLRARLKVQAERRLRRKLQHKTGDGRRYRSGGDAHLDCHSDGEVASRRHPLLHEAFAERSPMHFPVGGLTERAKQGRAFAFAPPKVKRSSRLSPDVEEGGASGYETDRSSEDIQTKTKSSHSLLSGGEKVTPLQLKQSISAASPREWLSVSSFSSYDSDDSLSDVEIERPRVRGLGSPAHLSSVQQPEERPVHLRVKTQAPSSVYLSPVAMRSHGPQVAPAPSSQPPQHSASAASLSEQLHSSQSRPGSAPWKHRDRRSGALPGLRALGLSSDSHLEHQNEQEGAGKDGKSREDDVSPMSASNLRFDDIHSEEEAHDDGKPSPYSPPIRVHPDVKEGVWITNGTADHSSSGSGRRGAENPHAVEMGTSSSSHPSPAITPEDTHTTAPGVPVRPANAGSLRGNAPAQLQIPDAGAPGRPGGLTPGHLPTPAHRRVSSENFMMDTTGGTPRIDPGSRKPPVGDFPHRLRDHPYEGENTQFRMGMPQGIRTPLSPPLAPVVGTHFSWDDTVVTTGSHAMGFSGSSEGMHPPSDPRRSMQRHSARRGRPRAISTTSLRSTATSGTWYTAHTGMSGYSSATGSSDGDSPTNSSNPGSPRAARWRRRDSRFTDDSYGMQPPALARIRSESMMSGGSLSSLASSYEDDESPLLASGGFDMFDPEVKREAGVTVAEAKVKHLTDKITRARARKAAKTRRHTEDNDSDGSPELLPRRDSVSSLRQHRGLRRTMSAGSRSSLFSLDEADIERLEKELETKKLASRTWAQHGFLSTLRTTPPLSDSSPHHPESAPAYTHPSADTATSHSSQHGFDPTLVRVSRRSSLISQDSGVPQAWTTTESPRSALMMHTRRVSIGSDGPRPTHRSLNMLIGSDSGSSGERSPVAEAAPSPSVVPSLPSPQRFSLARAPVPPLKLPLQAESTHRAPITNDMASPPQSPQAGRSRAIAFSEGRDAASTRSSNTMTPPSAMRSTAATSLSGRPPQSVRFTFTDSSPGVKEKQSSGPHSRHSSRESSASWANSAGSTPSTLSDTSGAEMSPTRLVDSVAVDDTSAGAATQSPHGTPPEPKPQTSRTPDATPVVGSSEEEQNSEEEEVVPEAGDEMVARMDHNNRDNDSDDDNQGGSGPSSRQANPSKQQYSTSRGTKAVEERPPTNPPSTGRSKQQQVVAAGDGEDHSPSAQGTYIPEPLAAGEDLKVFTSLDMGDLATATVGTPVHFEDDVDSPLPVAKEHEATAKKEKNGLSGWFFGDAANTVHPNPILATAFSSMDSAIPPSSSSATAESPGNNTLFKGWFFDDLLSSHSPKAENQEPPKKEQAGPALHDWFFGELVNSIVSPTSEKDAKTSEGKTAVPTPSTPNALHGWFFDDIMATNSSQAVVKTESPKKASSPEERNIINAWFFGERTTAVKETPSSPVAAGWFWSDLKKAKWTEVGRGNITQSTTSASGNRIVTARSKRSSPTRQLCQEPAPSARSTSAPNDAGALLRSWFFGNAAHSTRSSRKSTARPKVPPVTKHPLGALNGWFFGENSVVLEERQQQAEGAGSNVALKSDAATELEDESGTGNPTRKPLPGLAQWFFGETPSDSHDGQTECVEKENVVEEKASAPSAISSWFFGNKAPAPIDTTYTAPTSFDNSPSSASPKRLANLKSGVTPTKLARQDSALASVGWFFQAPTPKAHPQPASGGSSTPVSPDSSSHAFKTQNGNHSGAAPNTRSTASSRVGFFSGDGDGSDSDTDERWHMPEVVEEEYDSRGNGISKAKRQASAQSARGNGAPSHGSVHRRSRRGTRSGRSRPSESVERKKGPRDHTARERPESGRKNRPTNRPGSGRRDRHKTRNRPHTLSMLELQNPKHSEPPGLLELPLAHSSSIATIPLASPMSPHHRDDVSTRSRKLDSRGRPVSTASLWTQGLVGRTSRSQRSVSPIRLDPGSTGEGNDEHWSHRSTTASILAQARAETGRSRQTSRRSTRRDTAQVETLPPMRSPVTSQRSLLSRGQTRTPRLVPLSSLPDTTRSTHRHGESSPRTANAQRYANSRTERKVTEPTATGNRPQHISESVDESSPHQPEKKMNFRRKSSRREMKKLGRPGSASRQPKPTPRVSIEPPRASDPPSPVLTDWSPSNVPSTWATKFSAPTRCVASWWLQRARASLHFWTKYRYDYYGQGYGYKGEVGVGLVNDILAVMPCGLHVVAALRASIMKNPQARRLQLSEVPPPLIGNYVAPGWDGLIAPPFLVRFRPAHFLPSQEEPSKHRSAPSTASSEGHDAVQLGAAGPSSPPTQQQQTEDGTAASPPQIEASQAEGERYAASPSKRIVRRWVVPPGVQAPAESPPPPPPHRPPQVRRRKVRPRPFRLPPPPPSSRATAAKAVAEAAAAGEALERKATAASIQETTDTDVGFPSLELVGSSELVDTGVAEIGSGRPISPVAEDSEPGDVAADGAAVVVVAIADYDAKDEGELGFKAGDQLLVLERDASGWWLGRCMQARSIGWFPCTFVEVVAEAAEGDDAYGGSSDAGHSSADGGQERGGLWKWNWQSEVWEQVDSDGNILHTAVDPFGSPQARPQGSLSYLSSSSAGNDDMTASLEWDSADTARSFLSPQDVAAIEEGAAAIAAEAAQDAALVAAGFTAYNSSEGGGGEDNDSPAGDLLSFIDSTQSDEHYCRAVADYSAVDAEELSLAMGDTVLVHQMDDSGWWEGRNLRTNDFGWFPCTFIVSSEDWVNQGWGEEPIDAAAAQTLAAEVSSTTDAGYLEEQQHQVKALGDWSMEEDPSALRFVEGDVINVTAMHQDGWWEGYLQDPNQVGYFPVTYVEWIQ